MLITHKPHPSKGDEQLEKILLEFDFEIFTPQNLRGLFEEYKANSLAILKKINEQPEITLADFYDPEDYDNYIADSTRFSPCHMLSSLKDNPEYREAYNSFQEELVELGMLFAHNVSYYEKTLAFSKQPFFYLLHPEVQTMVRKEIRDYQLLGIDLPDEQKQKINTLINELNELQNKFEENCLDSREAWSLLITDKDELKGVPEPIMQALAAKAAEKDQEGYLLTLEHSILGPIIRLCENRELRKTILEASELIASPEDWTGGKYDNSEICTQVYDNLTQYAKTLGFATYADYVFIKQMAQDPKELLEFMYKLAAKGIKPAQEHFQKMAKYAKEKVGIDDYQPWDYAFVNNIYMKEFYQLDVEEIKKYYPVSKVLENLFTIINRLYGLTFEYCPEVKGWDPDVKFYKVYEEGELIAGFFLDMYARNGKRSGAWMGQLCSRMRIGNKLILPIAYLATNFLKPTGQEEHEQCLYLSEVSTIFHEMGHVLHHILSKTMISSLCGTRVERDAVEMPSQLNECFIVHMQALKEYSHHVETGEPMPQELLDKIKEVREANRNPLSLCGDLLYAIFDLELYSKDESDTRTVHEIYKQVYDKVIFPIANNPVKQYFPNQFSHIFAGGYSASYYSYFWSNILVADIFDSFKATKNIYDPTVAQRFKDSFLSMGGSRPSMENFIRFKGRTPDVEVLLKKYGITKDDLEEKLEAELEHQAAEQASEQASEQVTEQAAEQAAEKVAEQVAE